MKTLRELCISIKSICSDHSSALDIPQQNINFSKFGEIVSKAPSILIWALPTPDTNPLYTKANIFVWVACSDKSHLEAALLAYEKAETLRTILIDKCRDFPASADVSFDYVASSIAVCCIEAVVKFKRGN
jgi:hypothetical protein